MTRKEEHWLVNDADAKRYGAALVNASRHFPLKTTQKALDIGVLVFCIIQIETPRIVMSSGLAKARRAPQAASPGSGPMGQVFQFHSPHNPPPPPSGPSAGSAQASPRSASSPAEGNGAGPPIADPPLDPGEGAIGGGFNPDLMQ